MDGAGEDRSTGFQGSRRPAVAILALLTCLTLAGPGVTSAATGSAGAIEPRASLPQLEEEVMCPVCGTLLGLSRAPAAERQRAFIRGLIRKGRDEDQIKAALVSEYGPQVLALPEDEETDFFVYLLPVLGLVGGALLVMLAAISWRRKTRGDSPGVDRPSGAEAERLDRDLDRFGP